MNSSSRITLENNGKIRPQPDRELLADLAESDCGRLVLATTDWLFLIRPIRGAAAVPLDTFVIPRNGMTLLRLKAGGASCP